MRKRKSLCCSTLLCTGLARGRTAVEGVEKRCEKSGLVVPAEQQQHSREGEREAPHIPLGGRDGMGTR